MPCIFDLKLSSSDIIAVFAFLVAGFSAFFAYTSWNEVKRANRISLSSSINEIYDAFFELKMHMSQKSQFAEVSEISKFYYHSKKAKIHLPSPLAEDVEKYFDACFWLADIHRKNGGITKEIGVESSPHLETEKMLAPKIDYALSKLLQKVLV